MTTKIDAKVTMEGWEELPLELPEGLAAGAPKLVRMKFNRSYKGDLEGKGVGYYNSNYHNNGGDDPKKATARFAGLTYFSGEIKGVGKGTIVLIDEGNWDPASGAIHNIVSDPASGTGDLVGLKAKGRFVGTPTCQEDPLTLEIEK